MRRGDYDGLSFSLAFASVAGVMLVASRLAGRAVQQWGHAACFRSGAALILAAGLSLGGAAWIGGPLFLCFVVPMWIAAAGLVLMVSVTANGALADFGAAAGLAVALYYGLQSLLVAVVGTMLLALFDDGSAGPLAAYCVLMPAASLAAFSRLKKV
ncbi:drug resistance transporter, Bcr/CflA subfamily [Bordetella trematum]|nr:drug resistance transporter, Bcr/CflA subfamily [Bordetella trematum]